MTRRDRWALPIGMCIALAWNGVLLAQDRFESAPGPEPKAAPRPAPPPRERPRYRPAPEPAQRYYAPPVAVAPPPAPSFSQASLLGRWCAGGIQFTLTPSEWRYQLPDGQTAQFRVMGIQTGTGVATVTFQGQDSGLTINEFQQIDSNTILQLRGRNNSEGSWHYYNRSFRRC